MGKTFDNLPKDSGKEKNNFSEAFKGYPDFAKPTEPTPDDGKDKETLHQSLTSLYDAAREVGMHKLKTKKMVEEGRTEPTDSEIVGAVFSGFDAIYRIKQAGHDFSSDEKEYIADIVLSDYADNPRMMDVLFNDLFEAPEEIANYVEEKDDSFASYIKNDELNAHDIPMELSINDAFVKLLFREERPNLIENINRYSGKSLKLLASELNDGLKLPTRYGNSRLLKNIFDHKDELSASEMNAILSLMQDSDRYDSKQNGESTFEKLVEENAEYLIDMTSEAGNIPICLIKSKQFRDNCLDDNRFDLAVQCTLPQNFFENTELTESYRAELGMTVEEFDAAKEWLQDYYLYNNDVADSTLGTSLKNDIFNLNKAHYERFINDAGIQAKLAKLETSELNILSSILDEYNYHDFDITPMVENVVDNIKSYEPLIDSLESQQLPNEDLRSLVNVMQLPDNQYQINSLEDLRKYQDIKTEYFLSHFESSNLATNKDNLAKLLFNIDMDEADYIDYKYCHDDNDNNTLRSIKNSELPTEYYNYLAVIDALKNCNNNSELIDLAYQVKNEEVYQSEIPFESYLRSEYSKLYSESLYRINEKPDDIVRHVSYKGKDVQISMPRENFNLFLHCVGSCSEKEDENYMEDWLNRPHLQDHLVACSYINEKRINSIRSKDVIIFGFDSLEGGAILGMGDTDIDSIGSYTRAYNGSRTLQEGNGRRARYFTPTQILDSPKKGYNEIVVERRSNNDGFDGKPAKRSPDYIIMMAESDSIDNFTLPEDLAEDSDDKKSKAAYWEDCLKAASDFGIPLVVIDKSHYLANS